MIYDFHTHSTCSDGSLPAEEVVKLAKLANVDFLCLTDHDTLLSMDKAHTLDARVKDIKIFGGVEVSSYISGIHRQAHILAYNCDKDNKALKKLVSVTTAKRTDSFYQAIDIINNRGEVRIDHERIEEYRGKNGFYKQHLIKYLHDIGYTSQKHGNIRRRLFSKTHGYAHVPFEYPECTKVIEVIRNAGGIPMLAHTFFSDNFSAIDELIEAGLMGIEVYHPRHNDEQREVLDKFCDKRKLLVSCGSDFHGLSSNGSCALGTASVDNEKIRHFLSLLQK